MNPTLCSIIIISQKKENFTPLLKQKRRTKVRLLQKTLNLTISES